MWKFWSFATAAFLGAAGCMTPSRNATAILNAHSAELMARPGVVGVYLGLLPNSEKACIRVMVKDASFEKAIPRKIEGVPVRTEVSGEIRPMTGK